MDQPGRLTRRYLRCLLGRQLPSRAVLHVEVRGVAVRLLVAPAPVPRHGLHPRQAANIPPLALGDPPGGAHVLDLLVLVDDHQLVRPRADTHEQAQAPTRVDLLHVFPRRVLVHDLFPELQPQDLRRLPLDALVGRLAVARHLEPVHHEPHEVAQPGQDRMPDVHLHPHAFVQRRLHGSEALFHRLDRTLDHPVRPLAVLGR